MSLLDPDLKKRIEKYDKIINEKEQEYKNYCDILKKISEYTPNTDMEKIMRRFIFMQNEMIKEATNR
jgi:hypothetical protein